MNKENFEEYKNMEGPLEELYQFIQPSDKFLDNLEIHLKQIHNQVQSDNVLGPRQRLSFRWTMVPTVILFVLTVFVVAVGPKDVLARVQAMIGYVPGVGFVDVTDTRVLVAPISQTKDGITVTVKQLMAGPEETQLVLDVEGLEPIEKLYEYYWSQMSESDSQETYNAYKALWESDGRLILPDGTEIVGQNYQGSPWDGYYSMPTLPTNVLSARFEITRLPGVPADKAPQGWAFNLELGYVSDAHVDLLVGEFDPDSALLSYLVEADSGETNSEETTIGVASLEATTGDPNAPDTPGDTPVGESNTNSAPIVSLPGASQVHTTSETFGGFSLTVLDVVYSATETAIRLKVENIPLDWGFRDVSFFSGMLTLTDDLGNQYAGIYGPPPFNGLQSDGTYILTFAPVSPGASSLTLYAEKIMLYLGLNNQYVSVDFGNDPQIGSTLPMDSTIEAGGFPIHFNAAYIQDGEIGFYLDPVPGRNNLKVESVLFSDEVFHTLGINGSFGISGSGGGIGEKPTSVTSLIVSALPTGSYNLPIDKAQISINGPFIITWNVR